MWLQEQESVNKHYLEMQKLELVIYTPEDY